MRIFEIEDLKSFTTELFLRSKFDSFEICEADFVTFGTFHIDGRLQKDYFDTGEQEVMDVLEYTLWKEVKPFCLSLIKGKRLPLQFKIVLRLYPGHPLCKENEALQQEAEKQSLFLNILYRDKRLTCTTGSAALAFEPGRKPGQEWDAAAGSFLAG